MAEKLSPSSSSENKEAAPLVTLKKKDSIWRKIEKFSDMGLVAGSTAAALAFEFLPIILPYCIGLALFSFVTGKIAGTIDRINHINEDGPLSTKEKLELVVDAISTTSSKTRMLASLSSVFKTVAGRGGKPPSPMALERVPTARIAF